MGILNLFVSWSVQNASTPKLPNGFGWHFCAHGRRPVSYTCLAFWWRLPQGSITPGVDCPRGPATGAKMWFVTEMLVIAKLVDCLPVRNTRDFIWCLKLESPCMSFRTCNLLATWQKWLKTAWRVPCRVTTCLENLEISGNLTAVGEMSAILVKVRKVSGKKSCRGKVA